MTSKGHPVSCISGRSEFQTDPLPKLSHRDRFRRWRQDKIGSARESVASWIYGAIAGHEIERRDDDW